MMIALARMSSLVYHVAQVHLTWGMLNVWQSASVAKMSTITSCIVNRQRVDITLNSRLDYQPLFGKMSPHSSPRNSGWTRLISIVGFSQSGCRLQIFVWQTLSHKLSYDIRVFKMADDVEQMNAAFERVLETFQIDNLKDSQREVLEKLVSGLDVFVIQPTGSGKSLIFQSAPIVFDTVRPLSNAKSIALVISPLVSLMQDQVRYLKSVGISAEFIGDEQKSEEAKQLVERGECQIVYGSPESFLSTKRWRAMLNSDAYKDRLCLVAVDEAHCISHW